MTQEKYRKFYDDFGDRIAFIREKRGLTLGELSGGSASTAKSWEDGSRPNPDKWEAVAKRLGLSVSFVFLGKPTSREDFDFVAKFADELPEHSGRQAVEPAPHYPSQGAPRDATDALLSEARRRFDYIIAATREDPRRLGWVVEQMGIHLRKPDTWEEPETPEQIAKRLGLPTMGRQSEASGTAIHSTDRGSPRATQGAA